MDAAVVTHGRPAISDINSESSVMGSNMEPEQTYVSHLQDNANKLMELSSKASRPAGYTEHGLTFFYSVEIQYRRVVLSTQGLAIHTTQWVVSPRPEIQPLNSL